MDKEKQVFVIDGYGQIYRSYFAFMQNPLRDREGNNVSAIFGFFNTVISLLKQYQPKYLVVALDSQGKTFRHELFPEYKANREKSPEDLYQQIDRIVEILGKMNIAHIAQSGMEADDIIATIAKNAENNGLETVMVTGDKDLLQLVKNKVSALRPPRKGEHEYRLCHEAEVKEIFGVSPEQIVDYLTILGDSSDNVPGIAGIGEKGAVKLLSEYGTLDNAYASLDAMKGAVKTKLENSKDTIGLSRTLIQLKDDLFEKSDFSDFDVSKINWEEGVRQFSLIGSDKLVSVSKRMLGGKIVNVTLENTNDLINVPSDFTVNLNDPEKLIGYDLKTAIKEYKKNGIQAKAYFDIMIAEWLLDSNSGRYTLKDICLKYLQTDSIDETEAITKLYYILSEKLKASNLNDVFFNMEMPLLSILADMEEEGILLDCQRLRDFGSMIEQQCMKIESDIYSICGHPFNLNSPKQLQEVLFVERNLPTGKKTSTGFSTDSDVLEELARTTEDEVPKMLLRYRALSKLMSTYVSALPLLVDKHTGRIHTSFIQTGTSTGRLSSKNPNLQNIPIRTEEGRKIRDAFVPKEGCVLLSADYSQVELAVLAHISDDPELKAAFKNGDDVHKETAALIFGLFPEMVTPAQRRIAKTINFGVIYGMSAFRLSNDLEIPVKQAQSFIDTYFERYSKVNAFIEKTKEQAKQLGYIKTVMGHIRAIPDINSANYNVRSAAERMAVNSVIQGSAAEIVKKAMLILSEKLKPFKSKILLQVHDELILEADKSELEIVKQTVKSAMEEASFLSIPLRVSIETGASWGEMH